MGMQNQQFDTAGWIVVNTQPHRERVAQENLSRQDFVVYCPMIRKRCSHARKVETVLRPLFPSYLFVQASRTLGRWRPIHSTYGVRTIVRTGEQPSFVDNEFIVSLRKREVDGGVVRPPSPYQVGQRVRVAAGSFDGIVATIIEMDEKDRLVVLLDFMNRATRVKLKSEWVTPA